MKKADVTISVVVDESTEAWLKAQAKIEDVSLSRIVRGIIAEHRGGREKGGPTVSQTKLFDEIAPYNRLFIADNFISNGWMAVQMEEYYLNNNGLRQIVKACNLPASGQAAYLCGFLLKIPDWVERVAVFSPVDLSTPPYDDLDKLYFINAALLTLLTGNEGEWVYRIHKLATNSGELIPVVSVHYNDGQLSGFVAGLEINSNRPVIIEALKAL